VRLGNFSHHARLHRRPSAYFAGVVLFLADVPWARQ